MSENDDEPKRLRSEVEAQIALQMGRQKAYDQGEYELDDWEGFTCTECGWRGLSAPMADDWGENDEGEFIVTQCAECGEPGPETTDNPTKWHDVLVKLVNGDAEITFETHE